MIYDKNTRSFQIEKWFMGNKNEFYTLRIIQIFFFQMSAHFNYVGYILHQHVKRS